MAQPFVLARLEWLPELSLALPQMRWMGGYVTGPTVTCQMLGLVQAGTHPGNFQRIDMDPDAKSAVPLSLGTSAAQIDTAHKWERCMLPPMRSTSYSTSMEHVTSWVLHRT